LSNNVLDAAEQFDFRRQRPARPQVERRERGQLAARGRAVALAKWAAAAIGIVLEQVSSIAAA